MSYNDPNIKAKVICHSVNRFDNELITVVATYPRIILAEVNTHRALCLSGNSILSFDLPAGSGDSELRHHPMTIKEFHDKWHGGAKKHKSPNRLYNDKLNLLDPAKWYYAEELAEITGIDYNNINKLARDEKFLAFKKHYSRKWWINAQSFIEYRKSKEERVYSLRDRLSNMKIRQINEETKKIQHSIVTDVFKSERKSIYELRAGQFSVRASKDHLIFTDEGWKKLGDLSTDNIIFCQGRFKDDKVDNMRFSRIDGQYVAAWNGKNKKLIVDRQDGLCNSCKNPIDNYACHIHHIIPIHKSTDAAFDLNNVVALHVECHHKKHRIQGWQEGVELNVMRIKVDSITYVGEEETYDLSIAGEFPNFFADGIVVHNSRSTASSRAIPVAKQIEKVKSDPFYPTWLGAAQKGMQAAQEVDASTASQFRGIWDYATQSACSSAHDLQEIGIHKQITNRLLEPFGYVTSIFTATDWDNLFKLRCHKDAQPEFMALAFRILEAVVESKAIEQEYHIPFGDQMHHGLNQEERILVACARCARISYENHEGNQDPADDLRLTRSLIAAGHMSPFEHVARQHISDTYVGNFQGWVQHRKLLPMENVQKVNREELLATKPHWLS